MAYIVLDTIKDYKIPTHIYKLLSQHAQRNHNTIRKEIRDRLTKTLSPEYNYSGDKKLMELAIKKNTNCEQMCFDFNMGKKFTNIIDILKSHLSNADEVNYEMNLRLTYTLYDPFYYIK